MDKETIHLIEITIGYIVALFAIILCPIIWVKLALLAGTILYDATIK